MGLMRELGKTAIQYIVGKAAQRGIDLYPSWQQHRPIMRLGDYHSHLQANIQWVYKCVTMIAYAVSGAELKLYYAKSSSEGKGLFKTKGLGRDQERHLIKSVPGIMSKAADVEEVIDPAHPFNAIMQSMNSDFNRNEMFMLMIDYLELTGNNYWWLGIGQYGVPAEIWTIPAERMEIETDGIRKIGYVYTVGATKTPIPIEQVIHFSYPDPLTMPYGRGPLSAAADSVNTDHFIRKSQENIFKNGGHLDGYWSPKKEEIDQATFDRVAGEIRNRSQGYKNTGNTPFFSAPVEYKPIQIGPRELQFLQGLSITRDEIGGIFGVPKSMLTSDDVNRANAESGRRQFAEDTIEPKLRLYEQKFNEYLVKLFDPRLFVAFDSTVPQDRTYRLAELQNHLTTGYSSINEEREADGLEPVPWGDVPIMGMGMGPIGRDVEEPEEEPEEDVTDDEAEEETEEEKGFMKKGFVHPPEVWKKFEWRTRPHEDKVKAASIKLFREQELEILRDLKKSLKAVKGTDDVLAGMILDVQKWAAKWRKDLAEIDQGIYKDGGEQALEDVGSPISFDVRNLNAERFLAERENKISSIPEKTHNDLKKSLLEGIGEGESPTKLRDRVKGYFDYCENYRAEAIARTEVVGSYNAGTTEGYKQSGVVAGSEWVATQDDRTRDTHADMDGQKVGLGEMFVSPSGAKAEHPGGFGVPEEDINCRCLTIPVLKDEWNE